MVERLLRVFSVLAVTLLVGCASQTKRSEAELALILEWLPGRYDNVQQAQSDAQLQREPHTAVELNIARVYAPWIGEHVFYVQESAADDPRRILSQRLVAFEVVKGRGLVQSLWSLAEPLRWRDAHRNVDLFKGMMPQDFAPISGCELVWTLKEGQFSGKNDPAKCHVVPRSGEGAVQLELRAELTRDSLALADQSRDASGRLVQGNSAEPFYRFRKR